MLLRTVAGNTTFHGDAIATVAVEFSSVALPARRSLNDVARFQGSNTVRYKIEVRFTSRTGVTAQVHTYPMGQATITTDERAPSDSKGPRCCRKIGAEGISVGPGRIFSEHGAGGGGVFAVARIYRPAGTIDIGNPLVVAQTASLGGQLKYGGRGHGKPGDRGAVVLLLHGEGDPRQAGYIGRRASDIDVRQILGVAADLSTSTVPDILAVILPSSVLVILLPVPPLQPTSVSMARTTNAQK